MAKTFRKDIKVREGETAKPTPKLKRIQKRIDRRAAKQSLRNWEGRDAN